MSMQPKLLIKLHHIVPLNKTTFGSGLHRIPLYIEQRELINHIEWKAIFSVMFLNHINK